MYNPTEFSKAETTFFFLYNGSSQGPMGSTAAPIHIDSSATSAEWSTSGSNYEIQGLRDEHLMGRADGIMTPTSATQNAVFGSLRAKDNIDRGYAVPLSAFQDSPARTTHHCSLTDEVLHMFCDDDPNVYFEPNTAVSPDFSIPAGRAIIGGFLV